MRRLKVLEVQNRKLKQLVANLEPRQAGALGRGEKKP